MVLTICLLLSVLAGLTHASVRDTDVNIPDTHRWNFTINQLPWKIVIREDTDPLQLIVRTDFMGTIKFVEDDEFKIDIDARGSDNTSRKLKDIVDYSFLAYNTPDGQVMMLQLFDAPEVMEGGGGLWKKLSISIGLVMGSVVLATIMLTYMYKTISKREQADAHNKDRNNALSDDVKDSIINKFGIYLVRRARSYSQRLSNKADKLEAIWKRGSNYSRTSRIMKPSDVTARQAAAMAQAGTSAEENGQASGDTAFYTEPIYEEAEDDEQVDTVVDKFGVHIIQTAKAYSDGFSNKADKLEAILNTQRSSMYSRISEGDNGETEPLLISADVHTPQYTDGAEPRAGMPQDTMIDTHGVSLVRTARAYSRSLSRKADKLEEEMRKRASYPEHSNRTESDTGVDPTYSSDFFINRTTGVGIDSDYTSDQGHITDPIVYGTGVHAAKKSRPSTLPHKVRKMGSKLKRMSYPAYTSKSPDDHHTLVKSNRQKGRKRRASKILAKGCTGGQDTDDSDNCEGLNEDSNVGNGNLNDWRHSASAEGRRRNEVDADDHTYEEPIDVNHSTPDNKDRLAMEDSMTGSFTNSGYDSDSETDMSPVFIQDRMAEALTKRSAENKRYNRQVSTPSPDRSPLAVKRLMEAPFKNKSRDSGSDSSEMPENTSVLEQPSPEQSPSFLKKFHDRFNRRKSIPSPNRSPLTIKQEMPDPFSDVNSNHDDDRFNRRKSIPSPNRSTLTIKQQMPDPFSDVNSNHGDDDDSDVPKEEPPSPEVSLLTLRHQMTAGPFTSHSQGDLTTNNTYLSQTDNSPVYYNQNCTDNYKGRNTRTANNNPGDVETGSRIIPRGQNNMNNTSGLPHSKSEELLTTTVQPNAISHNNTLGRCQPTTGSPRCKQPQPGQPPCTKAVPCGKNCVHRSSEQMLKPPSNKITLLPVNPAASLVTSRCTGAGCTITGPCGKNCIHLRQADGRQQHWKTHNVPVAAAKPMELHCRGVACTTAIPCGKNCRHLTPKGPMTQMINRGASSKTMVVPSKMCKGNKCTRAAPCGRNCIHIAAMRPAKVPRVISPTKPHAPTRHHVTAAPQRVHNAHNTLPQTRGKAGASAGPPIHGQSGQPAAQNIHKTEAAPSPDDGVQLPSRRKGGWIKRGKNLHLTTLTVLSVICLTMPGIYATVNHHINVDMTIHVPRGFLKPGIQVFFNREAGGKVVIDKWAQSLEVSPFDVDAIHVNLARAAAANCTNSPCQHGCDLATGTCVCHRGYVTYEQERCEACSVSCPHGSFQDSPCNENDEKTCIECTSACPGGMFISKPCDQFSDIKCQACSRTCGPSEFESVPCAGPTDRQCAAMSELPPVFTSDNVIMENLEGIKTQRTEMFDASNNSKLIGKQITFHRGSGYTVKVYVNSVDVRPQYESGDHLAGNDLTFAPLKHKALCTYPVPEYYTMSMQIDRDITTLTKESQEFYYRSPNDPCITSYGYRAGTPPSYHPDNHMTCADPSTLSELFNSSHYLEQYSSLRVDKTKHCFNMNKTCSECSDKCAKSFDATSKTNIYCRLPASKAEVEAEGSDSVAARMKACFRCCMLGNCTICVDYQKQCQDQIRCRTGNILAYSLTPHYSDDVVYCHVQPKQGSVIYRIQYQVLYNGEIIKGRTFSADRVVDNKRPEGVTIGTNRHDFLLVKHGTGVTKRIHMVRGREQFEAGHQELGNKVEPTNNTSLRVNPIVPFGINTKTWKNKSCDLNVQRMLRGSNSTWHPIPDVQITHTSSGFSVYNRSARPYFQLVLPSRLSILQPFYGPTSLRNDRTLRAQLLRNDSFWIVKIAGQISPCPGLINVHIRMPGNVSLYHYDIGIDCPEDFSLEFHIQTGGPDVHDKRLQLEITDTYRSVNVTLFRPLKTSKYNFGNPKPYELNVQNFLISLSPFIIGTIALLIALAVILFYGYATRPDPQHRGLDNRLRKRHLMFVVWFIVFKFVYSLLVSVTEFVLIAKAVHSSTFNVIDQYPDYHHLVAHYEQIELNKIRFHLDEELLRQEEEGVAAKRVCEVQLYAVHQQVQEARENLLKLYYDTVQGFDIGSLAFEKVRETVDDYTERLKEFQEDFDRFAAQKARQLVADMKQVYYDIKDNSWLAGARIIHRTVNGLCFGCLSPFMSWVGLEFDFNALSNPDLRGLFPQPNLTSFSKPLITKPELPALPPMDFTVVPMQNLSTDIRNIHASPEQYKKYIPNPEFNFFLSSLRRNAIIIILVVIDSLWFAFRISRTYAKVVLLLHGFKYEIDVDEDDQKPKNKEDDTRTVGERARAAIQSGLAKLTDVFLDLGLRLFALMKNLYYRIMNTDLVPQLLMVIFLILTIYLLVIITQNMMDVDTLWNLGYFHLKAAPILMSRKVANTRITANAFKINNLEYQFYETLVNMRLKQYKILLKTYNRLMCERTSFQAVEYCAWWVQLYPDEACVPPVVKQMEINFMTCDLPPIEPITYTDFDSLAYRLELKRSMEPYVDAMQTMILHSFTALAVMIGVFLLIGGLGQLVMVLLKRFDLVRLLKVYNNAKDPSIKKEFLPACLDERKTLEREIKPMGAVEINTELFGERTHTAPTVFIQSKTLLR